MTILSLLLVRAMFVPATRTISSVPDPDPPADKRMILSVTGL